MTIALPPPLPWPARVSPPLSCPDAPGGAGYGMAGQGGAAGTRHVCILVSAGRDGGPAGPGPGPGGSCEAGRCVSYTLPAWRGYTDRPRPACRRLSLASYQFYSASDEAAAARVMSLMNDLTTCPSFGTRTTMCL